MRVCMCVCARMCVRARMCGDICVCVCAACLQYVHLALEQPPREDARLLLEQTARHHHRLRRLRRHRGRAPRAVGLPFQVEAAVAHAVPRAARAQQAEALLPVLVLVSDHLGDAAREQQEALRVAPRRAVQHLPRAHVRHRRLGGECGEDLLVHLAQQRHAAQPRHQRGALVGPPLGRRQQPHLSRQPAARLHRHRRLDRRWRQYVARLHQRLRSTPRRLDTRRLRRLVRLVTLPPSAAARRRLKYKARLLLRRHLRPQRGCPHCRIEHVLRRRLVGLSRVLEHMLLVHAQVLTIRLPRPQPVYLLRLGVDLLR